MIVNKPELFKPEYERYLLNRLRESTPFEEVPIRLVIRARRQSDTDPQPGFHDPPPMGIGAERPPTLRVGGRVPSYTAALRQTLHRKG